MMCSRLYVCTVVCRQHRVLALTDQREEGLCRVGIVVDQELSLVEHQNGSE